MELENNIIYTVTDKDFNIEENKNLEEPFTRYGSRGIVFDENNKIALVNKRVKNEYKLPGGGVDKNEDFKEAFIRECEEELGAKVEVISYLGDIVEYKSQENFKQISKVYVAKVVEKLESNNLTQKEIDEDTQITYKDIKTGLELVKNSLNKLVDSKYDNVYRSQFMVYRDIKILEYYIKKQD